MRKVFDYIIVGGGSAGCVLANRLSECGQYQVCLLEAGGVDNSIFIKMPSAVAVPLSTPKYTWAFESEPERHLKGRKIFSPRGKVIGGCSSINGMVYMRGHPLDYDEWESSGAEGWSYADTLPYFKRAEHRADGGDTWRGTGGPLKTRYGTLTNPLYRAFIGAAVDAGYAESEDLNGYRQEGFGRFDMTVHNGERWSTAAAYLRPALARPNLHVVYKALATKVIIQDGKAEAVEFTCGGEKRVYAAKREILLSSGPINTPQLLMLSGIGEESELVEHGIQPVHSLPGVGKNLQDHISLYIQVECKKPVTLNAISSVDKAKIGARWLLKRDGLGATNHFECGGFIRSRAGIKHPDIEIHFLPVAVREKGHPKLKEHGFQVDVGPTKSKSMGQVSLSSASPTDPPKITYNYLSKPEDWAEMRACIRLVREIINQPSLADFAGEELVPGRNIQSDDELDAFIAAHVESGYHPSGTCKMGSTADPEAVVDSSLKVIGINNLRVVDSSVIPVITNANLNAPTIMIAEKAADLILGHPLLSPEKADYYIPDNWMTHQR
ncbi:choline dehydrogenase [Pseudomonas syringae]|uniref:choline dehydrogenase n=1 Tax=Pseudomonas syringae TaxID=317 RepID=UPI001F0D9062|nr:choline dehydrogenase [Pseudomonas syringae]MCH5520382.1 choline dehydrogenase [Pseudomonas syringae pv. lapsa]